MKNSTMAAVRDYIRQPYTWPGGYPKVLIMADGEPMCSQCARRDYKLISHATRHGLTQDQWTAIGVDIYWEGPPLQCCNWGDCQNVIESAYGEVSDD
jgi:hypothetical protein